RWPVCRRGGPQRLRQEHAAAPAGRAGPAKPRRGTQCRCTPGGIPRRGAADVPGRTPAALEARDRQRRPGPFRRLATTGPAGAGRSRPGRTRPRVAGGAVRWTEAACSTGPRPDSSATAVAAGRATGRAGCADPHRDAAPDRTALAAARLHSAAGDPRCRRSGGGGRPGASYRGRRHRPRPQHRPATPTQPRRCRPGRAGSPGTGPRAATPCARRTPRTHHPLAHAIALGALNAPRSNLMTIKAINVRSQFKGTIKEFVHGDVLSEIDVQTAAGIVTSVITSRSVRELELGVGSEVIAFVKTTEVSIAKL